VTHTLFKHTRTLAVKQRSSTRFRRACQTTEACHTCSVLAADRSKVKRAILALKRN